MAFSLPFKQLAATAPVLRLLSQRDRNIRADQSARDPPFSGCGWHAYADLWCVASVMIKPRIRKAPWLIHCLIVPKGCSTVSRRRGRISGSPSGGLPSGRARPRFPDARPGDNAIGHGRRPGFWGQMCPLGHFNAESGGGSPASSTSYARYQSDLRAPKFCAAANPIVVLRTIVSKALSAAAASISGSDAWCGFLMISAWRGDGTSP